MLALDAEITPAYLGLVERGKRNATVLIIERICSALNISLSEFFSTDCIKKSPEDDIDKQILAQIAGFSDDEKLAFLHLTKSVMQFRQVSIKTKMKNK